MPTTAGIRIVGTGAYLPRRRVAVSEFALSGPEAPAFRHHAADDETAIFMGTRAAARALEEAGLQPTDLDGAIVFSGMPDFEYPKDGNAVVHRLGASRAAVWSIDTACASFVTGLEAARLRIMAGGLRRVLVLMVMNWVHRGTDEADDHSLQGDGAAAVIVEHEKAEESSFLGFRERTSGEHFSYLELPSPFFESAGTQDETEAGAAGGRAPAGHGLPTFRFGTDPAHGRFLVSGCLGPGRELLEETGTAPDQISWMIAHQSGRRLPRIWARSLGIPTERLLSTYEEAGNLSAVNIPLTLHHYTVTEPKIQPGDRILFFAPGAGLHTAAMLWRW